MTERFAPGKRKRTEALREHVAEELASAAWLGEDGRLVAVGGTVRNLAAAAQLAAGCPPTASRATGSRATRSAR